MCEFKWIAAKQREAGLGLAVDDLPRVELVRLKGRLGAVHLNLSRNLTRSKCRARLQIAVNIKMHPGNCS